MGGPALSFRTYMRGTCVYRAPEVYRHEESNDDHYYTLSADVYSFSMTCYEVFTGKRPLSETEWRPSEVKRFVLAGNRPLYPFPIPSPLRNLMERCWAQKPEDRPSFEDIRNELWQCKVYYAWPGQSSGNRPLYQASPFPSCLRDLSMRPKDDHLKTFAKTMPIFRPIPEWGAP